MTHAIGEVHDDSQDNERRTHNRQRSPGTLRILFEGSSRNEYRNGANNQKPEQGPAVFIGCDAPMRKTQSVCDDLNPIAKKEDEDRYQCADVKRNIESQTRVGKVEQPRDYSKMGGAADR